MSNIERIECPECGRQRSFVDGHECRGVLTIAEHDPQSWVRVEYVRSVDHAGAVDALRHILESAEHPSLTVRSTEYIAKVAGDALAALPLPRTLAPTEEDQ